MVPTPALRLLLIESSLTWPPIRTEVSVPDILIPPAIKVVTDLAGVAERPRERGRLRIARACEGIGVAFSVEFPFLSCWISYFRVVRLNIRPRHAIAGEGHNKHTSDVAKASTRKLAQINRPANCKILYTTRMRGTQDDWV